MCAGGATTTVYPTTQSEDVAYILANSGAKIVFAEDDAQVAKILEHPDAGAGADHDRPDLRADRRPTG